MWMQAYDPFGNEYVSAIIAFLPILFFLVGLTAFKMKGILAAGLTLLISFAVAVFVFQMPALKALSAIVLGIGNGLWPIGYIVIMAVWLYKLAVKSGKFDVIRGSIASISQDHRLQLLLIGFSFNAFLEGAAGFGVPIAISAALLAQLGFKPLKAAGLCLIANAASGAFGAIGIPVITGAQLGGISSLELSRTLALILPPVSFLIPFLLVFILNGFKGIKETLPALLVLSGTYTIIQTATMIFIGPELANIGAALISMGVLALFLRKWQPKHIYREKGAEVQEEPAKYTLGQVAKAWSPFYILTIVIAFWSAPFFKNLFAPEAPLAGWIAYLKMPFLHQEVVKIAPIAVTDTPMDAILKLDFVSATGTAILVAVILTSLFSRNINLKCAASGLQEAAKELWIPVLTICFIMAFANLSNYAGLSASIGLALAKTGSLFPLFSPILGWIGVFITGSVVSNNALFGTLQVVTGSQIGTSSALLLSANTAGGVMAKLISPQSIAIATAAVKETGNESALFNQTIKYSLMLAGFVCVLTFVLSLFL
ncbi:lactate permease LctP family transporter [Terribacillus saccharophilus]|uniref:L-lactate permease n=2 Tax=Terribacillus TaxID=459532 RepID=A0ABX4GYE6_9BACI|nr:lactate permease LctP family transporter [Terribacillus saccharophilus]PAD35840.1 L-lactate permease [Terribacillus saccharophilus]PAD96298.1 L-lactate permease [Terribacillus saccharophilus]PAD99873.1 L-lactate permease [Terribacillus saccharophilus]